MMFEAAGRIRQAIGLHNGPPCDVCGCRRRSLRCRVGEYGYFDCCRCGGVYVDPKRDPSFYLSTVTYLSDPEDYARLIDPRGFVSMLDTFERHYSKKVGGGRGRLLEIGAGLGFFLFAAFCRGWEVEGIETSAKAAAWAKQYLRMDVRHTTIESYEAAGQIDAIVMIEVLEHLWNPAQSLSRLRTLAGKPALLFGTTPNIESSCWQADQRIFAPDDHIFLFRPRTVERLLWDLAVERVSLEFFGGAENDAHILFSGVLKPA